MTAPARIRQSDLERAHRATARAGVREYRIRVDATGAMEIIVGASANEAGRPVELD